MRYVLPLLVLALAITAGSAKAVARMPVGFFDDPSFRWSEEVPQNLLDAQRAHASIIHILASWAAVAPTKPKNALSGSDPAYKLTDLDGVVRAAQQYGMEVLLTIAQTPPWANGGKTPNYPPTNLNDLQQFSQMLAARYNGKTKGQGIVTRFSVWNEPNLQLFLAPQFDSSGKIVSPQAYAKLYMAAYNGIKAGNPNALVAAGETSNRGRNHPTGIQSDSVAPATFARLVAEANPKLPFDAWATHPYPTNYRLGPAQKVSYPNVQFSTMTRFGADLAKWFNRPVPIWVTEYGEQTPPASAIYSPVTNAQQAADAKKALQLAAANPYVQMFTWFIFRDSDAKTWFSGLVAANGKKKPAYSTFTNTAQGIVGFAFTVPAGQKISVKMPVPVMAYYNKVGTKLGMTYGLFDGKKKLAVAQPLVPLQTGGYVTIPVNYKAGAGKTYTLGVTINDPHGHVLRTVITLLPSSTAPTTSKAKKKK
jgi:aryl-phospho-beta-D-glucosidase BglC (GH1 family)